MKRCFPDLSNYFYMTLVNIFTTCLTHSWKVWGSSYLIVLKIVTEIWVCYILHIYMQIFVLYLHHYQAIFRKIFYLNQVHVLTNYMRTRTMLLQLDLLNNYECLLGPGPCITCNINSCSDIFWSKRKTIAL